MLCGSAAALIAVSVPLVGMNAFGEAGAPAATPTGTVETEEAAVTTEAAEPESHALSEDEIAHQKYLCRYDFVEADGYFKMDSVNLDKLWDTDELNIRPHYLNESDQIPGKLYLSSKTGAWEDILLKDLSLKDNSESVTMGSIRDAISLSLDLSDAYLKLVRNDNKTNIDKGNPCTGGDPDVVEELTPEEVKDVEFVDSFDSENLFTSTTNGFGINKMYSQKNELGNGKYNQRFIMQVKTADVANIDSYSIIISSGTKNVKINCYGLSSSITINGNNIKADEDCVFLSAAVVDVNDSVELSYSDFTYEHGGVVDEA